MNAFTFPIRVINYKQIKKIKEYNIEDFVNYFALFLDRNGIKSMCYKTDLEI